MVTFRPPSINTSTSVFSGAKSNLMGTRDLLLLMGATEASSSSLRALKFRWAKVVDPKVINVKHIWKIRSNSKNMLVTLGDSIKLEFTPEFCVGFFFLSRYSPEQPRTFAWVNRCKVVPRFIFTRTTQCDDTFMLHCATRRCHDVPNHFKIVIRPKRETNTQKYVKSNSSLIF